MPACCNAPSHPWDRWRVGQRSMPTPLRCLVVGENPGDVTSEYFYEPPADPKRDRVRVRRELLDGLCGVGLITEPTLEAFRDAGFLFDHAIRCTLPSSTVNQERLKANRYGSERAAHPLHLMPLLKQARLVWVMGHVAGNAVANAAADFPKEPRRFHRRRIPVRLGRALATSSPSTSTGSTRRRLRKSSPRSPGLHARTTSKPRRGLRHPRCLTRRRPIATARSHVQG
jgi:hypothetical protein